jgi:C4-dicarboxylate-specific signal transduction histidine kinase
MLVRPQVSQSGLELDDQVGAAKAICVGADLERVVLVLTNLIFNARDALVGRPSQRIELGAFSLGEEACITVRDNGPGLTPQQQLRLFEPFYTTKPLGSGLGLGLALSQRTMASLGGRITADNHPDGGAIFSVWFRRAPPQAVTDPAAAVRAVVSQ